MPQRVPFRRCEHQSRPHRHRLRLRPPSARRRRARDRDRPSHHPHRRPRVRRPRRPHPGRVLGQVRRLAQPARNRSAGARPLRSCVPAPRGRWRHQRGRHQPQRRAQRHDAIGRARCSRCRRHDSGHRGRQPAVHARPRRHRDGLRPAGGRWRQPPGRGRPCPRPGHPHQGVGRARHAGEPEEGWSHRRRQGHAGLGPGDQADHRGARRQGGTRRQAAHAARRSPSWWRPWSTPDRWRT